MKKIIWILTFMTVSIAAIGQTDDSRNTQGDDELITLVGQSNAVGGYGAISMQYTRLDDRDAFVFGARGGLLLGHLVTIGLGGSGFFNDVHYDSNLGSDISLAGGYGGFFFEPVLMPKLPVHVCFPVLIGAGGASVVSVNKNDNFWEDNFKSEASDAFMVIEPGIEIELNVTKFFRFCVGGYYRYTTDIDIEYPLEYQMPADILRGFSGGVTFKFGRF